MTDAAGDVGTVHDDGESAVGSTVTGVGTIEARTQSVGRIAMSFDPNRRLPFLSSDVVSALAEGTR